MLRRIFNFKVNNYYFKYSFYGERRILDKSYELINTNNFSIQTNISRKDKGNNRNYVQKNHYLWYYVLRRLKSSNILDGDISKLQRNVKVKEIKPIAELFPNPKATLNELAQKLPEKVFDVHFKQSLITPKTKKKKLVQANEWMCTYSFVWPNKMKFESTAISKKQASDKAASEALNWLYSEKKINNSGHPIHDISKVKELKSQLNEPFQANMSDSSIERIKRIWSDYEDGIRNIFLKTKENAINVAIQDPVHTSDSLNDGINDVMHPVYGRHINPPDKSTLERREMALQRSLDNFEEKKVSLPIDEFESKIVSTIEQNQVTIIVGAAGCGKSTRAPLAAVRHNRSHVTALVSEPRRVAAIGLADRVAEELGEEVGQTVGYQVRLRSKPPRPPGGSILYCTSGVLLKRLQDNPGLIGCTHVFIDEAHERDVNIDISLLLLKKALKLNPQLKLIVMSATLDTQVFTRYFNECPVVEVPGKTYPVLITHLEDLPNILGPINLAQTMDMCERDTKPIVYCDEVVKVIKAIDKTKPDGAILVFLPGWAEIKETHKLLLQEFSSSTHLIVPVHSRLSTEDQTKIFTRPLPGVRKIVISTNICETCVTIPDAVYVVDCGTHKENTLIEGTGMASLETVWVSMAGAKQRAGRAGRVQPGHCFRLYTKEREAEFSQYTTPEILRIPLQHTALDCKTYSPNERIEQFLSQLPEPPSNNAVKLAVNDLIDLGALTKKEDVTRLGKHLSAFTLSPRLACTLLHSSIVGNVLAVANMTSNLGENIDVFRSSMDRRAEIREIKRKFNKTSDHCALHWIQDEFEQNLEEMGWERIDKWCEKYGLRKDRLGYLKALSNMHLEELLKSNFLERRPVIKELNRFSDLDEFTTGVLLSGANSLLVTRRTLKTKKKLGVVMETFTSNGDRAHIGTESVNSDICKHTTKPKRQLLAFFGGYHSTDRRALVVHKTSVVSPETVLLFSKGPCFVNPNPNDDNTSIISLPRHRLQIEVPVSQADYFIKARQLLWDTLEYYYNRDLNDIDTSDIESITYFKIRLMKSIGRVLVETESERETTEERDSDNDGVS